MKSQSIQHKRGADLTRMRIFPSCSGPVHPLQKQEWYRVGSTIPGGTVGGRNQSSDSPPQPMMHHPGTHSPWPQSPLSLFDFAHSPFYFLHMTGCSQLHSGETSSSTLSPLTWTICYTFNSSSQILSKLKMRELSLKRMQMVWSCGSLSTIHEKLQLYLPRSEVKNQWPHHIYK